MKSGSVLFWPGVWDLGSGIWNPEFHLRSPTDITTMCEIQNTKKKTPNADAEQWISSGQFLLFIAHNKQGLYINIEIRSIPSRIRA